MPPKVADPYLSSLWGLHYMLRLADFRKKPRALKNFPGPLQKLIVLGCPNPKHSESSFGSSRSEV